MVRYFLLGSQVGFGGHSFWKNGELRRLVVEKSTSLRGSTEKKAELESTKNTKHITAALWNHFGPGHI
jgi:hypothetical protein